MDRRRTGMAGTVALALLLAGCRSPVQESSWTVGACALVNNHGTTAVACSDPHTHTVVAIAKDAEGCPRDTDLYAGPADPSDGGPTACFKSDTTQQ